MLALAWWGWALLVIGGLAAMVAVGLATYRRNVRREFVQFVADAFPEFQVSEQRSAYLKLRRTDGGEGVLYLHKLYGAVAVLKIPTPEQKREIFQHFADAVLKPNVELAAPLTLEQHGPSVMPMLVTPQFLAGLSSHARYP